ncbi:MAG: DUF2179 domain-containing protein [Methanosarcinaceae archaeon]|nr:DUF2179 domain-containing protein [Methanosarcinaceae archaeon]MDD4332226.1 DUF2179 domain-containing protein [Methanosarcinaceae archaeon]MDD4748911.1 DUF2179 domain-containing protein [Methanosarcinaceae archaeon]
MKYSLYNIRIAEKEAKLREYILGYFLIFFARICDVSMSTVRTLMIVHGKKFHASAIGFLETIIYVCALGKVVSGLEDPGNLLAYALGFASGNYVGISIEEKIAIGNFTAQVILKTDENEKLLESLREKGFGVTSLQGSGKEGNREILNISFRRKDLEKLKQTLYEHDERAFIVVNNIKPISGGYFSQKKK